MKSILMLALFAATPAMALISGDNNSEMAVDYLSWCDGNNVIGQDSQGQLFVSANCTDLGLTCKASEPMYRAQRMIMTATCVKK